MKKEFIKSVATAALGLALVSSCSSAKDKEAHKCAGQNSCTAKKEDAAEKNTCKAAKEVKKAKRNIEK